jgi:hypothetical protein
VLVAASALLGTASVANAQSSPPPDSDFQKVTLNPHPGEPMGLAVLPGNKVLYTARPGQVRVNDPKTGLNTLAADLHPYQHDEEGVQSIAIDPNFAKNQWVYLYYSPVLNTPVDDPVTPVNEGDAPEFGTPADFAPYDGHIQLSRFKWNDRTNKIDLGTDHAGERQSRYLLPRRRSYRLRQPGQPVPVDGR